MQNNIVSVKELNKILNNEKFSGTFTDIDIVFIAGLFLLYMQNKNNWKKIPQLFNLTENKSAHNHSHYFKQIDELYGVKHYDIFDYFPNATNATANSFSRFFAPPIYITNKSIDYFFGTQKSNMRIDKLKNKYRGHFDIFDFVDKRSCKKSTPDFEKYQIELQQRLQIVSTIFVFIFIISCKRLAQKENRTFEKTKDYVEKIWQFTQEYVRGLHELAKNIVEHSGKENNNGQGMITIRAYSESEMDKTKVLETHVFDYGKTGIIPKLREYTDKRIKSNETNLSNSQKKVNNAYKADLNMLKSGFTLDDFIKGKMLEQQKFRHIGHYGINKLQKLVEEKPLQGEMFIASKAMNGKTEYYGENAEVLTLSEGTHYFFRIPFMLNNFEKIDAPTYKPQEFSTLGSSDALQKLRKREIKTIQLYELNKENIEEFDGILDITVDCKIDKKLTDNIGAHFNYLSRLNNTIVVSLNLDSCIIDGESNLLRFLGSLMEEYKQSFVIYNLDFDIYKKMIDDNKAFAETRKWEAFWNKDKGILVFTKVKNKDFYFADILYGDKIENYYSVNKSLGNTFPNSVSVVDKEMENAQLNDDIILSDFFNDNALLPYDILLKCKKKELFLYNIEKILQNDLFREALISDKEEKVNSIEEVLENYIDNFEGYCIHNTHFKIGNKVHSADFYYAKRLFQNSFYTTRLAMHLAILINKKINDSKIKITLVGYEMYSELALSLTKKFLKDIYKYENVNHYIAQNEDNKMIFLPKDTFNNYLTEYNKRETIIIVPIAATGNTARKIENDIREQIFKQEKNKNHKSKEEAERLKDQYDFFEPRYNIILAQDPREEFNEIRNSNKKQESIVELNAEWYKIKDCILCYGGGIDINGEPIPTKPLFDTDNSSLTPSLIFGNPEGQTKLEEGEIDSGIKFGDLNFENSINYQSVARNDNYRIYDVDSDIFIRDNKSEIENWLRDTVKFYLENNCNLRSIDRIVIVAPCHESNSQFINLINEKVFSSTATIIHYQNSVDFKENFNLLNKNYLIGENTKIFYVDDSLITGGHFFELFDLIREVTQNPQPLTASILINDQAIPFIHNRAVRWSKNYFAFVSYNQPSTLNMIDSHPLEKEHKRYELLRESALHDTLREHFHKKANKLNPEKRHVKEKESSEKQIRRLKMFEATHKIYEYFADKNNKIPNELDELLVKLDFKLRQSVRNLHKKEEIDMNRKALLKVLSQYPFILYKDLRIKTFYWHKERLSKINIPDETCFDIDEDYDKEFSTFKFRLRRAAFFGNYQILEIDFLRKLLVWFRKIDLYFLSKENRKEHENIEHDIFSDIEIEELKKKEEKLHDFPIFVLGNYIEMIQKNTWTAYKILSNINQDKEFLLQLKDSYQGKQFLYMLQMESGSVIDDFMKMINKDYRIKWRDMCKKIEQTELYTHTDKIVNFFESERELLKTNKYELVKEAFLDNSDDWRKNDTPFVNYLWIKQLLYADSIDKATQIKIGYQEEIDAIIDKMKGFYPNKEKIQTFFIITDGQQKPYVLSPKDNSILNEFTDEFLKNKPLRNLEIETEILKKITQKDKKELIDRKKELIEKEVEIKGLKKGVKDRLQTRTLIDFLEGTHCNAGNATETTAEFIFENKKWKNIYTNEDTTLEFMPPEYKWVYLIRISKLKEDKEGNCEFETQGLLGFYSTDDLREYILPKQLLMLLRQDMGKFIGKHHKNDEFADLIQQKEKNKYVLRLNHGIGDYRNAIEDILKKCNDTFLKDDLEVFYEYLILKLNLIDKLSSKTTIEAISLQTIKNEFKSKYKKVLSLNVASVKGIPKEDIQSLVKLNIFEDINNLNEEYYFPESSIEDIVFELLNNIRKNVCNIDKWKIQTETPLVINIAMVNEYGNKYLSVTNNHVRVLDKPHSEEDVPHGLDLLRQMWNAHNLGKIITPSYPLKESSFTIKIQLKETENEKSNYN